MNLSEHFIRRPVMTVLLNAAIVLAGVIGYRSQATISIVAKRLCAAIAIGDG